MRQATFILGLLIGSLAYGQESYADYGKHVYELVLNGSNELYDQFVDLNDYTAYIDRLEKLPEHLKEEIKRDATKSYTDVRKDYSLECSRILDLYKNARQEGTTFKYSATEYAASKNFPDIGFLTVYYIVNIPGFEEPEEDALRFECIKTVNGWRILDGFFDANDL